MKSIGRKWSAIGKELHRTENAIKNHARSMAIKSNRTSSKGKNFFN
jgi:hypothetical protein